MSKNAHGWRFGVSKSYRFLVLWKWIGVMVLNAIAVNDTISLVTVGEWWWDCKRVFHVFSLEAIE